MNLSGRSISVTDIDSGPAASRRFTKSHFNPVASQYPRTLTGITTGDWGRSFGKLIVQRPEFGVGFFCDVKMMTSPLMNPPP
jgi:hypothetical protein